MEPLTTLAIWTPSVYELLIIMVIALLLFGKRLPEVARSLGKGVVEFKKGLKGIEDDVDRSEYQAPKGQPARRTYADEPRPPSSEEAPKP